MNVEQRNNVVFLAGKALSHAYADRWSEAGACVQWIHDTYGGEGIQLMLIVVADIFLGSLGPRPPGAVVVPQWMTTSGDVKETDSVPPALRWAGRFIAARAADDEPACAALYNSCTTDEEFTANVCAVIEITATTLMTIEGARRGERN